MVSEPLGDATHYRIHIRYRIFALVTLILAALFGWQLFASLPGVLAGEEDAGLDWGLLFFFLVTLAMTFWYGRGMLTRVWTDDQGIGVRSPGAGSLYVAYRQLAGVNEAGRAGRTLTLIYHPLQPSGLVDLDDLRTISLPEVEAQDELSELLTEKCPA